MAADSLIHALIALAQITLIDITLAGDNAVVIGMAVRNLDGRDRRLALMFGTGFAAVLRVGLALLASTLLTVIGLTLAGGILLLWVCWKMYRELRTPEHHPESDGAPPRLAPAILRIVVADLSMSLDNVLAVAGAAVGHPGILVAGLVLSVVLMGVAASFVANLLTRYRWIAWLGLLVVLIVSIELIVRGWGKSGTMRSQFKSRLAAGFLLTAVASSGANLSAAPKNGATTASDAGSAPLVTSEPLQKRLAEWLILTGPGATALPPIRYADFLQQTPQWPLRQRIFWRFQNALSHTSDPATLDALCPLFPLSTPAAFLECASHMPDASGTARRLWLSGAPLILSEEQAIEPLVGRDITPDDQWTRYTALERRGLFSAASRQIMRLAPERQALARARLAERLASPDADALFSALPDVQRTDPVLIQFRLRALRRGDRLQDAFNLWNAQGASLQRSTPSQEWSSERLSLARALLLAGRANDAAALANDTTLPQDTTAAQDAALLSGFIALRELGAPARAEQFFRLLDHATSLQMRARGHYWTARALAAAGKSEQAAEEFRNAATFPTTFPGQLAIAALSGDEAILTSGESSPQFDAALATALAALPSLPSGALERTDLLSAAEALVDMGDKDNAREFLMMLEVVNPSPEGQKAVADAASRLGLAAPEVFASYALARKGFALYPQGYPDPYPHISNTPDGLVPAIIRQESAFDPDALSAAHAVGLLQILPAAAKDVVRRGHLRGLNISAAGLLDPQTNLSVGNAYVSQLLERFGGVIPYTLAAYNAGPHRVDLWLKADPPSVPLSEDGLLDWIERLPYRETRLYIENIEAGMMIYRVRSAHAG